MKMKNLMGKNKFILTLTDGCPYVPSGKNSMSNRIKDNDLEGLVELDIKRDTYPNHTFGFGNEINYELLQTISRKSNAHSFYISDVSMLPTVFLNAIALFLSTVIRNIEVTIKSEEFEISDKILRNYNIISETEIQCKIPSLSRGQEYNILIPLKNTSFKNSVSFTGYTTTGKLEINTSVFDPAGEGGVWTEKTSSTNITSWRGSPTLPRIGYSTNVQENYIRLLFITAIKKGINYMETRRNQKAKYLITTLHENWEDIYGGKIDDEEGSSSEIYKDLIGQVFEAFNITSQGEKEDYYNIWGKNYLRSLSHSHLNMLYSNFKDAGLEVYNTGELFGDILENLTNKFKSLPPPKPSASYSYSYGGNHSATRAVRPPDMNSFMSRNTVCYDGSCYTDTENGKKQLKYITNGDKVRTCNGFGKVIAIVKSPIDNILTMISFPNGLLITPWHPIRVKNKWYFPESLTQSKSQLPTGKYKNIKCESIYSFVLENGHTMFVGGKDSEGIETVTLGHDFPGLPKHTYFGSEKVIEDVQKNIDSDGVAICMGTIKDDSDLVIGLKFKE